MAIKWSEVRDKLNYTPEDICAIEFEKSLIRAVIEAREQNSLTQKDLSEKCGLHQSVLARLENTVHSPQVNTLLKVLLPMGYTLAVVPIKAIQNYNMVVSTTEVGFSELNTKRDSVYQNDTKQVWETFQPSAA